jgi:hypothetical protein
MRLVGIGLLLAAVGAGCAMQSGSDGDADWARPQEVTANPNGGSPSSTLLPSSMHGAVTSTGDNGGSRSSGSPQKHPDPAPWVTAPGTAPGGGASPSDPTTGEDNPNGHPDPAPWYGGDTTVGGTGTGDEQSASAPSTGEDEQKDHRRLPVTLAAP